jgi:hypothetical protein
MAATPQDHQKKKTSKEAPKVSTASSWKKANQAQVLPLPSGEVCLVKRPGLPQLMADNVLPDVLMPIAMKAVEQGQKGVAMSQKESSDMIAEVVADGSGLTSLFDATDRITAHCVVEPTCLYHRREVKGSPGEWETIPDSDRDDDAVYTDQVSEEDKMYIFNFVVGGTRDLERFRQELSGLVDGVEDVAKAQGNPG